MYKIYNQITLLINQLNNQLSDMITYILKK